MSVSTYFAPAERTEPRKFADQVRTCGTSPLMNALMETIGGLLVVLNEDRQVVAMNHAFLSALGVDDPAQLLGLRLGETLRCVHAAEEPNGCGTTPFCASCGAAIAMMAAIREGRTSEETCALTSVRDGVRVDTSLAIRAQPLVADGRRWVLIFARDTTQEQFWTSLERVFLHDVNNVLAAALGTGELLALDLPGNPRIGQLCNAVQRLADEVAVQRELSRQRDGGSWVRTAEVSLADLRAGLDAIVSGHPAAAARSLDARWPEGAVTVRTNATLATKVLVNMVLNALEATPGGGCVRISVTEEPDAIRCEVWNAGAIPTVVQPRIFQRYFSTKSRLGRGLGTYSMKLFGEEYLRGEVSFTSTPERGTTFTFRLPRSREA